jgi:hypothetical protein
MRTYELTLANGQTVVQCADDSFEAVCLASARYGAEVKTFRRIDVDGPRLAA